MYVWRKEKKKGILSAVRKARGATATRKNCVVISFAKIPDPLKRLYFRFFAKIVFVVFSWAFNYSGLMYNRKCGGFILFSEDFNDFPPCTKKPPTPCVPHHHPPTGTRSLPTLSHNYNTTYHHYYLKSPVTSKLAKLDKDVHPPSSRTRADQHAQRGERERGPVCLPVHCVFPLFFQYVLCVSPREFVGSCRSSVDAAGGSCASRELTCAAGLMRRSL